MRHPLSEAGLARSKRLTCSDFICSVGGQQNDKNEGRRDDRALHSLNLSDLSEYCKLSYCPPVDTLRSFCNFEPYASHRMLVRLVIVCELGRSLADSICSHSLSSPQNKSQGRQGEHWH